MQRRICFLLLFSLFGTSKGIALPTSLPRCNCILLKECHSIAHLLLNHKPLETEMIYEIVKNASCGYAGLDPLVCCSTTNVNHGIVTSAYSTDSDTSTRAQPDAWVWVREESPTQFTKFTNLPEAASPMLTKSKKSKTKALYNENDIIDFKDPLTKGNWPHSFFEEAFEYHNNDVNNNEGQDYNINHPEDVHEQHTSPTPHSQHPHHFGAHGFHPHHHYHVHHHDSATHNENDFMDEDYKPHPSFRPINNDAIFIYPDDERLKQPFSHIPTYEKKPTTKIIPRTTVKPSVKPTEQTKINAARCGLPELDVRSGERIYPWISRIAYINKTSNAITYRCAGSVVTESHILTAAHCVTNLVKDLQLSHIRIGGLTFSPNCTSNRSANCSTTARSYQIDRVYVHPTYDQPPYAHDIALVKIDGKANDFTPICLPPNLSSSVWDQFIGTAGIALGWTANARGNDTAVTPTVRYLSLPIVNTTECAITYAEFNNPIVITPSQLCAQGGPMNDVCQGDSGGPLMDEGSSGLINSNGRHSLLGIVAFGPTKCGMSNIPGVYTRVSSYLEWIIETISLN